MDPLVVNQTVFNIPIIDIAKNYFAWKCKRNIEDVRIDDFTYETVEEFTTKIVTAMTIDDVTLSKYATPHDVYFAMLRYLQDEYGFGIDFDDKPMIYCTKEQASSLNIYITLNLY